MTIKVTNKIKEELSKDTKVAKITVSESGRQIKVMLTLNNDFPPSDGNVLGEKVSTYFNESQLGYYDFERRKRI